LWNGDAGTSGVQAASISAYVDGTPGTNDMPGRLVFSTTADGASTPTERMRITSAGDVGIGGTPSGDYKLQVFGDVAGTEVVATNGITINSSTITANATIPAGFNASSIGPITIASGVTVTVASGSRWVTL
jgi:hypothetical protein